MLPLFAAAYVIPLLLTHHDLPLTLSSAALIGVLCLVVAETVAWITARLHRSQAALIRAHAALNDMSADLISVDTQSLAQRASSRLSLLLEVPNVDIYGLSPDGSLTRLASTLEGSPAADPGRAAPGPLVLEGGSDCHGHEAAGGGP